MSSGYPMTGIVVVAVNKLYSIYAHFQSADQNTSKTADKKKFTCNSSQCQYVLIPTVEFQFGLLSFSQAESVHRDENES